MPREPISLVREGGFREAEKMFVLSYEGSVSEKKYFEDFRNSEFFNDGGLIEIISLRRSKKQGSDPISVKNLLKKAKSEYNFGKDDEFWLIIDRDQWEDIHHIDFDELVLECQAEKNFFLAMSNPCFEIWLVLHLKDLEDFDQKERNAIFKNAKVSRSKNYIDKVLETLQGRGYKKRPNPSIFLPLTNIAIMRAKKLDNDDANYPKGIGTHIYKLIEKLKNPNA